MDNSLIHLLGGGYETYSPQFNLIRWFECTMVKNYILQTILLMHIVSPHTPSLSFSQANNLYEFLSDIQKVSSDTNKHPCFDFLRFDSALNLFLQHCNVLCLIFCLWEKRKVASIGQAKFQAARSCAVLALLQIGITYRHIICIAQSVLI